LAKSPTPYGLKITNSCQDCLSQASNIFSGLAPASLERLIAIRQVSLYPARAVLFVEREEPRGLFILCEGTARLSVTSRVGKRITLRRVDACETLGLSSVMGDSPHFATAETLSSCQVSFFPKAEFIAIVRSHPDISMRIFRQLSAELHHAWNQTCLVALAPNARAKLANAAPVQSPTPRPGHRRWRSHCSELYRRTSGRGDWSQPGNRHPIACGV